MLPSRKPWYANYLLGQPLFPPAKTVLIMLLAYLLHMSVWKATFGLQILKFCLCNGTLTDSKASRESGECFAFVS